MKNKHFLKTLSLLTVSVSTILGSVGQAQEASADRYNGKSYYMFNGQELSQILTQKPITFDSSIGVTYNSSEEMSDAKITNPQVQLDLRAQNLEYRYDVVFSKEAISEIKLEDVGLNLQNLIQNKQLQIRASFEKCVNAAADVTEEDEKVGKLYLYCQLKSSAVVDKGTGKQVWSLLDQQSSDALFVLNGFNSKSKPGSDFDAATAKKYAGKKTFSIFTTAHSDLESIAKQTESAQDLQSLLQILREKEKNGHRVRDNSLIEFHDLQLK